jgi:hypothetical protein
LDLLKFLQTSTSTAMLNYGFGSKYSSLLFLWHAHVLQILKFYVFSQRNRQALEHVCCQLDKLELSYSSWVMGSLTWSLYTDRQKKGVLRHTSCRFLGARGLVSILFRFLHSLLFLSHTFLPTFPLFLLFLAFICFLFHYLFVYLLIYLRSDAAGLGIALQAGRSRVRFPISLEIFVDIILPAALWPWSSVSP